MPGANRSPERVGILVVFLSYFLWGFAPLYWPLVVPATPMETLMHRVLWSFVLLLLILFPLRLWGATFALVRSLKSLGILTIASFFVSINWYFFIWAVDNDHLLDSSLGYFLNPLMSVFLGVTVLRERLSPLQWSAIGLAVVAMVVITIGAGGVPWITLALASSFAFYGLVKKIANMPAIPALTVETALATPIAVAYLIFLQSQGTLAFGHVSTSNTLLLIGAGVVTVIPLLMFGFAVTRIPLSTTGILQYVNPVMQFLIGVFIFRESMTETRWIGFFIVWIALVLFSIDLLRQSRKTGGLQVKDFPIDPRDAAAEN